MMSATEAAHMARAAFDFNDGEWSDSESWLSGVDEGDYATINGVKFTCVELVTESDSWGYRTPKRVVLEVIYERWKMYIAADAAGGYFGAPQLGEWVEVFEQPVVVSRFSEVKR